MKTRNKREDLEEERLIKNLHLIIKEVVRLAILQSLDIRKSLFILNSFYRVRRKNLKATVEIRRVDEETVEVGVAVIREKGEKENSDGYIKSFQKVVPRKGWHPDKTDEEFLRSCKISPN